MPDPIRIDGLADFGRNLKKLDAELPKALRVALNEAANVVVGHAVSPVPKRSGRGAASIKARSTAKAVRVVEGGNRAPYMPWLDFGGRVGRKRSVSRPFMKDGRYIYEAYFAHKDEFGQVLTHALVDVANKVGVVVD